MTAELPFTGFSRDMVPFYRELVENNNKAWFEANRERFEKNVLEPARQYIEAMGLRLRELAPEVNAIPKVNKSLFKIHRDTRFSRDKTPFKDHLGIWMWEGSGHRMANSGFYFHIDRFELILGVGMHHFPDTLLQAYRDSVMHARYGPELREAIKTITRDPEIQVHGLHYKRVPRGYPADHPLADLLRHKGVYASMRQPHPEILYSAEFIEYSFSWFKKMLPLHLWMRDMTRRAAS